MAVEGNITTIVFDCNNESYATELVNTIGAAATADTDKVTVKLDGSASSYFVENLEKQVRVDAVTVTYVK